LIFKCNIYPVRIGILATKFLWNGNTRNSKRSPDEIFLSSRAEIVNIESGGISEGTAKSEHTLELVRGGDVNHTIASTFWQGK